MPDLEHHELVVQMTEKESGHHLWVLGERGAVSMVFFPEVREVIGHSVSDGPCLHRPAKEVETPLDVDVVQEDCMFLPGRVWCWCTRLYLPLPGRRELEAYYDVDGTDAVFVYLELCYYEQFMSCAPANQG